MKKRNINFLKKKILENQYPTHFPIEDISISNPKYQKTKHKYKHKAFIRGGFAPPQARSASVQRFRFRFRFSPKYIKIPKFLFLSKSKKKGSDPTRE